MIVSLLFISQAPIILNNSSSWVGAPSAPIRCSCLRAEWMSPILLFTEEGREGPGISPMAPELGHVLEPGSLCCPPEVFPLHYTGRPPERKPRMNAVNGQNRIMLTKWNLRIWEKSPEQLPSVLVLFTSHIWEFSILKLPFSILSFIYIKIDFLFILENMTTLI